MLNTANNARRAAGAARRALLGAIALVTLAAPAARADRVVLANGERYAGTVIAQDRLTLRLKTAFGELVFRKAEIADVVYEKPAGTPDRVNVYTFDNKVYCGLLEAQSATNLLVRTGAGLFAIDKLRVEAVDWRERPYLPDPDNSYLRAGGVWRSALVPGWGQFWQGRAGWGWAYAAACAGLLTGALAAHKAYADADAAYQALPHDAVRYARVEDRRRLYNGLVIGFGAVWLWQAADALLFAPALRNTRTVVALAPALDGVTLALNVRF